MGAASVVRCSFGSPCSDIVPHAEGAKIMRWRAPELPPKAKGLTKENLDLEHQFVDANLSTRRRSRCCKIFVVVSLFGVTTFPQKLDRNTEKVLLNQWLEGALAGVPSATPQFPLTDQALSGLFLFSGDKPGITRPPGAAFPGRSEPHRPTWNRCVETSPPSDRAAWRRRQASSLP